MQRALGIDLGTTNSVMAWMRRGEPQIIAGRDGQSLTPSLVGRSPAGQLLIGAAAAERLLLDPQQIIFSIKRLIGRSFADAEVQGAINMLPYALHAGPDGDIHVQLGEFSYSPVELSALLLRRLKEDAEARLHERFSRAVITVPAYFGERQVAATREAGRMAGFRVLRIINEPTAAALAYGLNQRPDADGKTILVYDLGGGTFDLSVLLLAQGAFTVLATQGDNLLGGDDFDRLLLDRLLAEVQKQHGTDLQGDPAALQQLRSAAQAAKIHLSRLPHAEVATAPLGRAGLTLNTQISRAEFEERIRAPLERTIALTRTVIDEAGIPNDMIAAVLLVGGSTAIPLVAELLSAEFGAAKIRQDVDPLQCVALGAAIQTALLTELECSACRHNNAIQRDTCENCGAPLYGSPRVACTRCFTLADASRANCRKCRATLPPLPNEPAAAAPLLTIPTGLRCQACQNINLPGAERCVMCGAPLVQLLADVTPKPIGIELESGQLAVMIDKGSIYPTDPDQPVSREFYTSVIDQPRLEVAIYEGPYAIARQNELCGIVTLSLPPGLPRGTPISISIGLDRDRTLLVDVRIRAPGVIARRVQLRRGRLAPQQQQLLREERAQVTGFLDRWRTGLTEAERRALHELIDQLDAAHAADPQAADMAIDTLVAHARALINLAVRVRSTDAFLSNIPLVIGHRLTATLRNQIEQVDEQLSEARREADWQRAGQLVQQADALIEQIGQPLRYVATAAILANQRRLSPALNERVLTVLRAIDRAYASGNSTQIAQSLDSLYQLWPELETDLAQHDPDPVVITGLTDRMSR